MTELIKSLFPMLLKGFSKYFKPTVFVLLVILIIWLMSNDREDKTISDQNCKDQLQAAQAELSDTRKQLLQYVLQSEQRQQNTAKNDSSLRKQYKNIMP
ncbi:hypothetical protein AAW12_15925 [Sphingobacterium sp. Ag1]|uniref:hypothetical protein n=1 Tax=Sphingobacterium sp. Ag1 TaxID=1643451 RepID=UPI000627A7AE|nr:hypothetical protein [Sphingobacterium sp. Ag1]KKO90565.1 hypothetical protein AAW12_15925 [Sphingobacterium sp. Ag1]